MTIFLENKYTTWYERIISNRKSYPLVGCYTEIHHIVPRSLGGSNDLTNLVALSAREHYLCHKLLTKMTTGDNNRKMWWAYHRMIHGNTTVLSGKAYEKFRKQWAVFAAVNHPSKTTDHWCDQVSESVRKSWIGAESRKAKTGETFRSSFYERLNRDPEGILAEQKRRAKIGAQRAKEAVAKRLEYNGATYLGYKDLEDATGVTKSLYEKLYLNGFDPTFRIKRNGPMNSLDVEELIRQYCHRLNEILPYDEPSYESMIGRLIAIGVLDRSKGEKFMQIKFSRKVSN